MQLWPLKGDFRWKKWEDPVWEEEEKQKQGPREVDRKGEDGGENIAQFSKTTERII